MWLQRWLHFRKRWYYYLGLQVTQVAFKNCAPSIKCITKIHGTTIDNVEHLVLVMPIYNLIKHSSNYSKTTAS